MTEAEFINEMERLDNKYKEAMKLSKKEFEAVNEGLSARIVALFLLFGQERGVDLDIDNLDNIVEHKKTAYNDIQRINKRYTDKIATLEKSSSTDILTINRVKREYKRVLDEAIKNSDFLLSVRGSDGKVRRYTATHYTNLYNDAVAGRVAIEGAIVDSMSSGRSVDRASTVLKIPTRGSTDACRGYEGKYVSADGSKTSAIIDGKEVKLYSLPALLANRREIFHPFCRHYGIIAVSVDSFV